MYLLLLGFKHQPLSVIISTHSLILVILYGRQKPGKIHVSVKHFQDPAAEKHAQVAAPYERDAERRGGVSSQGPGMQTLDPTTTDRVTLQTYFIST